VLEPYLSTVVLGGTALRLAGSADQQDEILPGIAAGERRLAFAHYERQSRYDMTDVLTTARANAGGFVLEGAKATVLHGDSADTLIVSARTAGGRDDEAGLSLFLVDAASPGIARRGYTLRDGSRAAELSLSGVQVPREALLGQQDNALPIIRRVPGGAPDDDAGGAAEEALGGDICTEAMGSRRRSDQGWLPRLSPS
jgi:alkylation response protein AidB-like acyl-CoA dehydrogenase